jgi:glycosyltransferase involved in cell wall biosynthesis
MRIAIVAPSPESVGGQSAQARLLRDHLERDGHVVLAVPIDPAFPRPLAWVRRLRGVRTILNQLLYVPSLTELRRADVVVVFAASYWSFLLAPVPAVLAARWFGRRVALTYHSGEADDHLRRWGRLVHPWLRMVDELIVPSEYLARVFAEHGYRPRVIHNVLDTSRYRYRERRPLEPRLLSVRHFEPHYRVEVALRAFGHVRARIPQATLIVAGAGSEEARLRRVAQEIGASGIRFVGRVAPDEMPALYDAADLLINASTVDNQPVSLLEAFAAGLAVVSTASGDIPAMLGHGATGRLVAHDDPAAMAAAIVELLAAPERTRAMTRRAHAALESYRWPQVQHGWNTLMRAA